MRILFKKRLSIILVMLMVLSGMNGLLIGDDKVYANGVAFAGGTGTVDDPYQIANAEDLDGIRLHPEVNKYFVLMNDIDLSAFSEGEGWDPIGFRGNLDGNGFKITNLKVNRPNTDFVGLFKVVSGSLTNIILEEIEVIGRYGTGGLAGINMGIISNITVTGSVYSVGDTNNRLNTGGLVGDNYSIITNSHSSASISGGNNVGGLVGDNSGTISNSSASGNVTGEGSVVGGLVGISKEFNGEDGSIKNSYATGNVSGGFRMGGLVGDNQLPIYSSYATGNVTVTRDNDKEHEIGGLAGHNYSAIHNSFARGNVSGTNLVGGLVGSNQETGSVSNSYATGMVSVTTDTYSVGGLVGEHVGDGEISNSFYDGQTTLQSDTGKGDNKTTEVMKSDDTYEDWNFTDIWGIDSERNDGYPYLQVFKSVTYDGNGSTGGDVPLDNSFYPQGVTASVYGNIGDLAKTDYTFAGWNMAGTVSDAVYAAGDRFTIAADTTLYAIWLSTAATLTSTIGTVSTGGTETETITNIPYGTTLTALKAAVTPAADATFEIYNADGTTPATTLTTGKKVVVTAQDGITKVTYTVTVNSAPSDSDEDSPAPPSTNETVTSTDGTLTLPTGRTGEVSLDEEVTVFVPVDATDKELILTIEKVLDTQSLLTNQEVLVSSVFEILKNFPENFNRSVTLTFIFDSASLKSNQRAAIFYYDEVEKVWVEIGGVLSGDKITVDVNHFTKYAVLAVDGANEPATDTPTLSDISGHWAETHIKQAANEGIVNGYPDGTFKPNQIVTRAEFTLMLMNALKLQEVGIELIFTDKAMIGAWAQKAVEQAVQAGIINGYLDGTFRPSAEITRAEMAKMIAGTLGQAIELHANVTDFADNEDIPVWAKGSIAYLSDEDIMQGKGNNEFAPQDHTTRAEAVTVLLSMLAKER